MLHFASFGRDRGHVYRGPYGGSLSRPSKTGSAAAASGFAKFNRLLRIEGELAHTIFSGGAISLVDVRMNARLNQLKVLTALVDQFGLSRFAPVQASTAIAQDGLIDVAVLGRFKSGKSSLLNTVLGEPFFPVGVLPVTAVSLPE